MVYKTNWYSYEDPSKRRELFSAVNCRRCKMSTGHIPPSANDSDKARSVLEAKKKRFSLFSAAPR